MSGAALLDHFSALDDPRQAGKVLYPLPEVMLLVLCATLAGAEDFVEIRLWGRRKAAAWNHDYLRALITKTAHRPSSDSPAGAPSALPAALAKAYRSSIVLRWVECVGIVGS
jgi:hypothetical protein